jgi:CBS domain-containing protein
MVAATLGRYWRRRRRIAMRTNGDRPALERLLGTVGEAMTTPVLALDADTPADVAARQLAQGVAGAAVLHRGRVVGVVTLDDLLARPLPGLPAGQLPGPFPRHERLLASLRVWQLMRAGPLVVAADQPLVEAARLLAEHRLQVLPVVDSHGRPVGIIARDDVIRALSRHARTPRPPATRVPRRVPDVASG